MQVRDFLEPAAVYCDRDTLATVAATLNAGGPVFYPREAMWQLMVARDALGYPQTRRLIDLPSLTVHPVCLTEDVEDVLQRTSDWEFIPVHDRGAVVGYVNRGELVNPVTERYESDALIASLVRPLIHDLGNSLAIAMAVLDPALVGSRRESDLEQAQLAVRHAVSLLGRAQNIASAKVEQEADRVELNTLLNEVEGLLRAAAGAVQLDLQRHAGRLWVSASRRVVLRALLNLVLNARQAIDNTGTIRVTVGQTETESGWCRLTVEDDGPGIDATVRDTLFQAGASTHGPGHGLGLFGTRRALARVGGRIQPCTSTLGGAAFEILFRKS